MNEIAKDYYLAHHGIMGQRWGVRRFQNKDGTLTSAGRKRYGDDGDTENAQVRSGIYSKAKEKFKLKSKKQSDQDSSSKNLDQNNEATSFLKSYKDMTNEELRQMKTRYDLEREYLISKHKLEEELLYPNSNNNNNNNNNYNKNKNNNEKSFREKFKDEVIKPVLISSSKKWLEQVTNMTFDKVFKKDEDKESVEYLKREADKWVSKKKISEAQRQIRKNEEEEKHENTDKEAQSHNQSKKKKKKSDKVE